MFTASPMPNPAGSPIPQDGCIVSALWDDRLNSEKRTLVLSDGPRERERKCIQSIELCVSKSFAAEVDHRRLSISLRHARREPQGYITVTCVQCPLCWPRPPPRPRVPRPDSSALPGRILTQSPAPVMAIRELWTEHAPDHSV